MSETPLVVDLHRNALDDGPGIRTTVFLKGCVLDCAWCQNPEAISPKQELQRKSGVCIGCRSCEAACEHGAISFDGALRGYDPSRCEVCGACLRACPPGGIRLAGVSYAVDELVALLLQDELFYRHSGGGVTWSGGEATMHAAYVAEASRRLRERGIHVLLQTCGLFAWDRFEAELLPQLDMIWFDLKLADPEEHRRHTGAGNGRILENLGRLAREHGGKLLVRIPLVPGITDTEANLRASAAILRSNGLERAAVLPYNPLWIPKRLDLGLALRYRHDRFMSKDDLERCKRTLRDEGIAVV